jgi:hypothetical protein
MLTWSRSLLTQGCTKTKSWNIQVLTSHWVRFWWTLQHHDLSIIIITMIQDQNSAQGTLPNAVPAIGM